MGADITGAVLGGLAWCFLSAGCCHCMIPMVARPGCFQGARMPFGTRTPPPYPRGAGERGEGVVYGVPKVGNQQAASVGVRETVHSWAEPANGRMHVGPYASVQLACPPRPSAIDEQHTPNQA